MYAVLQQSSSGLITTTLGIVLLIYGFQMVIDRKITQGLLLSFFLYISFTAAGVSAFSGLYSSIRVGLGN